MLGMFRSLWTYRGFVISSIRNEFAARFSRSKLGGLWMIIHPLSQVAIYALILSNVLATKLPGIENKYAYSLYLMAGMLGWSLFSEIISRLLNLFIEQGNLMKKMKFPRITLPTITIGAALLNNILLFVALLLVFALLGAPPHAGMISIIPLTLITVALASGIGLILGVLNVFVRDIGQVVPIVLQIWFWFTPVVYPANIIPDKYQTYLAYNPMYPLITSYHEALVYSNPLEFKRIFIIAAVALVLMALGLFMFRRSAPEMVDVL
ncbi:lipopolysaccharide ABC export system, permease [Pseudomonas knackmussii B13]|uniref:Transport permease protein n=1 Tax=Pseudomonas knackmussii (strain DSM 6978 / CCUG 54928 / LMG 23759 / B13) TaxID=1301098 RepID=A0A024HQ59_PSEKB|nr:ABC transporter permease [Pseudomonas knackmussii]CDF86799.1 lipopolysaccharide ABC export system, permease [Pseudomonas knackmussii B13]